MQSRTLFVALAMLMTLSAFAQEVGPGPDVAIRPGNASYTIDAGTAQKIDLAIKFADSDGLRRDTLAVHLRNGSSSEIVTGIVWTADPSGSFATAKATVFLVQSGDNVITASIADNTGAVGSGQATYRVTYTDPALPIVSTAPHHDDYRNTALGAAALNFEMPQYTSLGTARTVGLRYDSEQADPTGSVQLDARIHYTRKEYYTGGVLTLQIIDAVTGQPVTSEMAWSITADGMPQRLAAQWRMHDRPTGAYMYWADVRAYRSDGGAPALTRVPIRVLVVNHASSRYGSGWSIAALPRIHSASPATDAGLLIEEGTGVARWFAKESCGYTQCTYRTPAGDFSTIVYNRQADQWVRTFVDGTVATFAGAGRGLLVAMADRFGHTARFEWRSSTDGQNVPLLVKITDPVGKATTLSYHTSDYLKSITDPAGRTAMFYYQGTDLTHLYGDVRALDLIVGYTSWHRVYTYTNARGTWDVSYDARGMLGSVTAPGVAVSSGLFVRPKRSYGSLQALTVTGKTIAQPPHTGAAAVRADQVFTTVTDPANHVTQIAADRYGNPTKVIDGSGITAFSATWAESGLPLTVSDPHQTVAYTWNSRGLLLAKEVQGSVVYHASYVSGDQPTYEHDGQKGTWYHYGDRGQVLTSWYGRQTDNPKNATVYEYDATLRRVAMTTPTGQRTEWSYDTTWQNVAEERKRNQDGSWRTTRYTYDAAGREATITNALGETTTTTYDSLNRPLRVVEPEQRTSEFVYSGLDLATFIDSSQKRYSYKYNALGWLEQETFPDGKTRTASYTADGLLAARTDRRGPAFKVEIAYDASHRIVSRTADGVRTTMSYTSTQEVLKNNEVEEILQYHPEAGVPYLWKYTLGSVTYVVEKLLQQTRGWASSGIDVHRYSGSTLLRTDSVRYLPEYSPSNPSFSSTLVVQDFTGRFTTLGFNADGKHVETAYPNGVTQTNFYNGEGRLTAKSVPRVPSLSAQYEYDALGRLTSRKSAAGDFGSFYYYDPNGQLFLFQKARLEPVLGCNPSYETCDYLWVPTHEERYLYDSIGNRTNSGATLEPSSNRYRTFNGYTLEYDAEGNLTRKYKAGFDQRLTWNSLGQLASVTTNGEIVTYGYAPSGKRFRRTEAGRAQYYVYDGANILLEADSTGNTVRRYTHLPGIDSPLSIRETFGTTDTTHYYAIDHPGHVIAILDGNGNISAAYDYAPFGAHTTGAGQPLRFMARELDFASGLYYVRSRWYDAALARFVSEDPIGLAGGTNTYAYAKNDPVNLRDPMGTCPDLELTEREYQRFREDFRRATGLDPNVVLQELGCSVTIVNESSLDQNNTALTRAQREEARRTRIREVNLKYARVMELYVGVVLRNGGPTWRMHYGAPEGVTENVEECAHRAAGRAYRRHGELIEESVRGGGGGWVPRTSNFNNFVRFLVDASVCLPVGGLVGLGQNLGIVKK